MTTLFIAGTYDTHNGKPSHYAAKISSTLQPILPHNLYNGGTLAQLHNYAALIPYTDIIIWWANVTDPNQPKLIDTFKTANPKALLITSKRNTQGKYTHLQLISRALNLKSNLLIEFTTATHAEHAEQIAATILDPLGNAYTWNETDINKVATTIAKRITQLTQFTRLPSTQLPATHPEPYQIIDEDFLALAREYAKTYHQLLNISTSRHLGNLSFRCPHGFPTQRTGETILVSQRNIDKQGITAQNLVQVQLHPTHTVQYHGPNKPSVDTPIQLELYRKYPEINYILHAHTYIQDAPKTKHIIPCGALEEIDDITPLINDQSPTYFKINLRGHGSIAGANTVSKLRYLQYIPRPIPENHADL